MLTYCRIIAGGTNTTGVKGRVVQVTLAGWLLSTKTNLRAVTLANMNVKALPNEMFPMALVNLTLTNLYLESLPGDLPSQTKLERLCVMSTKASVLLSYHCIVCELTSLWPCD